MENELWDDGVVYRNRTSGNLLLCIQAPRKRSDGLWAWLTAFDSIERGYKDSYTLVRTSPNGELPYQNTTSPIKWRRSFDVVFRLGEEMAEVANLAGGKEDGI